MDYSADRLHLVPPVRAGFRFVLANLDSINQGLVVRAAGVGDHDFAAAVGRSREGLDHCCVLRAGGGINIKVGEYGCAALIATLNSRFFAALQ